MKHQHLFVYATPTTLPHSRKSILILLILSLGSVSHFIQVMNIKDPKEFQRIAQDYCKDMAMELTLPAYHRLATRISKLCAKKREAFDAWDTTEKVIQVITE